MLSIDQIEFVGSFPDLSDCPKPDEPEYVFLGRSNVGKSSLINYICQRNKLAYTSKKPGKTRLFNYYYINRDWYLVDLPGYGYAKVSKKERRAWNKKIRTFLVERQSLASACLLIDFKTGIQKNDREMLKFLGEQAIPFVIMYTKTDKVKRSKQQKQLNEIQRELKEQWDKLPPEFLTSSVKEWGRESILRFIEHTNKVIHSRREMK